MNVKNNKWLLILCLLLLQNSCSMPSEDSYILPKPDWYDHNTSIPCILGKLQAASDKKIIVDNKEILIDKDTDITTYYGGLVTPNRLEIGSDISVWFKGKNCKAPFLPLTAAYIMVESRLTFEEAEKR